MVATQLNTQQAFSKFSTLLDCESNERSVQAKSTMVDIITNQVFRADSYSIRVTAEIENTEDTEAFRLPTQME